MKKHERLGGYPPDRFKMVLAYQFSKTCIFDTQRRNMKGHESKMKGHECNMKGNEC